jgi:integrative and conjugative element protein (TIGR02256 family)
MADGVEKLLLTMVAIYVIVPASVVRMIEKFAIEATEAGGIFLGRHPPPHIEIVAATEPMPKDRRSLLSFYRRDPGHQREAHQRWTRSGGTVACVKEWHTHPEVIPSPSSIDVSNWSRIRQREKSCPLRRSTRC